MTSKPRASKVSEPTAKYSDVRILQQEPKPGYALSIAIARPLDTNVATFWAPHSVTKRLIHSQAGLVSCLRRACHRLSP